jgi:hypothetical protein
MVSDPKRLTAHESGATRYCQMLWIGVARQEVLPKLVDSAVGVLTRPGSSGSPSVGSHGRRTVPDARRDPSPQPRPQ